MNLKKTVWGIDVVGPQGIHAQNDVAFGESEDGKPALQLGENIITGEGGGGDSVWEKGTGEDSVQQKDTLCAATGAQAVATGLNTHAGATASFTEGALTTTRNDYDEETETGFDAAYSHVEGLNNATNNVAEHGEGKYGWSYYTEDHDPSKNSIHYVGVGTNNQAEYRKNAEVIMGNGDKYLLGVGGYDGKNIEGAQTVQDTIKKMEVHVVHFTGVDSSDQSLIADKTPLEVKQGMARGELWYGAGQVLTWEVPMSPISFGIISQNSEEPLQTLTCCTLTQVDNGTIKSWPMIAGMLINNKWGLEA